MDHELRALWRIAEYDPTALERWHVERRRRGFDPPVLTEAIMREIPLSYKLKALRGVPWIDLIRGIFQAYRYQSKHIVTGWRSGGRRRRRASAIVKHFKELRKGSSK